MTCNDIIIIILNVLLFLLLLQLIHNKRKLQKDTR